MNIPTLQLRNLIGGAWIDGAGVPEHSENPAEPSSSSRP
jgi:hypothetical protein